MAGNLLSEYFDLDDPCVDKGNDNGEIESLVNAFSFCKGITYTNQYRDRTTGRRLVKEMHIVR